MTSKFAATVTFFFFNFIFLMRLNICFDVKLNMNDQNFKEAILHELNEWENEDSDIDEPITGKNVEQGANGNQEWARDGNQELVAVGNGEQAVDQNDCIVSEHDTDSVVEVSGGGENVGTDKYEEVDENIHLSKSNFRWSKVELKRNVHVVAHNIL
ncbi:uncharacterized protein LOC142319223 [Lycorma delicatula]|uniref:uncharacterized protein LOC142319223 n=1 Tax=Lycorma delicatula TaxID=130591 RepID=UPI003F50EBBB